MIAFLVRCAVLGALAGMSLHAVVWGHGVAIPDGRVMLAARVPLCR